MNNALLQYQTFIRFAGIGICNTAIHASIVIFLVAQMHAQPVLANILAFFSTNLFSFFANTRYTFKVIPSFKHYAQFLMTSLTSLFLTITLSAAAQILGFHYLVGLMGVIIFGPVFTFLILKYFTFRII